MNCKEINELDPIEVLNNYGIKAVSIQHNEAKYKAPYRNENTPSLCYNLEKRIWFDFGTNQGGKMIDLLLLIYKVNTVSEVLQRFNDDYENRYFSFSRLKEKPTPRIMVKQKYEVLAINSMTSSSLIRYLSSRGVFKKTWQPYLKEISISNGKKTFSGIGFKNDSQGYEFRYPKMKNGLCLGSKDISTIVNKKSEIIVFEGYMDFLSFVEFKRFKNQTVIVLNSVVNSHKAALKIEQYFSSEETIIELYLDNDKAGKSVTNEFKEQFNNVIDMSIHYRKYKDLNECLTAKLKKKNKEMSM